MGYAILCIIPQWRSCQTVTHYAFQENEALNENFLILVKSKIITRVSTLNFVKLLTPFRSSSMVSKRSFRYNA